MEAAFLTCYLLEEKQFKKTDKIDEDKIPYLLSNQDNFILYQQNLKTHHKRKKISESAQN